MARMFSSTIEAQAHAREMLASGAWPEEAAVMGFLVKLDEVVIERLFDRSGHPLVNASRTWNAADYADREAANAIELSIIAEATA